VDQRTIRERVSSLQQEVARIEEQNRQYLSAGHHSHVAAALHRDREERLVQILEELGPLTKSKTFRK